MQVLDNASDLFNEFYYVSKEKYEGKKKDI